MPRRRRGLEPPYGIIWRHLKQGEVVPFLGAGASLGAATAPAAGAAVYPPSGSELAEELARESSFPSTSRHDRSDLIKVASFYQEQGGRDSLRERLREIFVAQYPWGKVHEFLASIEPNLLIVTTNYDDLIERALDHRRKPYHLVVHATDESERAASVMWWKPGAAEPEYFTPAELPLKPVRDGTIVYKMHGTVCRDCADFDSFVVTEDDYIEFLARMTAGSAVPAKFREYFRRSRFLYLGYGLADWNLRVMLKNLEPQTPGMGGGRVSGRGVAEGMQAVKELGRAPGEKTPRVDRAGRRRRKSWAIQYHPSPLERLLWRSRHVDIFEMTVDEFIDGTAAVVDADRRAGPAAGGARDDPS